LQTGLKGNKICSRCKQKKSLSSFGKDKSEKDNINRTCKECLQKRRYEKTEGVKRRERLPVINGMKKCSTCKEIKPISSFNYSSRSISKLSDACKDCHNLDNKMKRVKNGERYKFLDKQRDHRIRGAYNNIKSSYSCINCGEDDSTCLDFHHIDPKLKEYNISKLGRAHLPDTTILEKELAKCVCLCANCHRKLHAYKWKIVDNKVVKT
jgi:hypothetical protein